MWRGIYLSKIAGDGEEDSRTDGLDDRAFLPTRYRADD
jgi:hypothetical protein